MALDFSRDRKKYLQTVAGLITHFFLIIPLNSPDCIYCDVLVAYKSNGLIQTKLMRYLTPKRLKRITFCSLIRA